MVAGGLFSSFSVFSNSCHSSCAGLPYILGDIGIGNEKVYFCESIAFILKCVDAFENCG